ncbi:uncharacterized protein LOC123803851 [Ursus americanus]|uniref:uncharacterized protein LOC123803851 n=1 Tax=Ursus americanus TaxID=9643 RepID=UPI001E679BAC|nr:uncharacterized protein LOC123803851 [Ursus americanus]
MVARRALLVAQVGPALRQDPPPAPPPASATPEAFQQRARCFAFPQTFAWTHPTGFLDGHAPLWAFGRGYRSYGGKSAANFRTPTPRQFCFSFASQPELGVAVLLLRTRRRFLTEAGEKIRPGGCRGLERTPPTPTGLLIPPPMLLNTTCFALVNPVQWTQIYVEGEASLKFQPQLHSVMSTNWRESHNKIYKQSFPVIFPKHFSLIQ